MSLTRRQFIGAMSLPLFLPETVWGRNNQVNLGFIGAGHRANSLRVPATANITGVCDIIRERAESLANQYQAKVYNNYRALIESSDIDAVIITTPDHWHALPAILACQAGKDVYCEKPLGLTINEGKKLVQAARKYNRVFQVGTQQRSHRREQIGCELIRTGQMGNVKRVLIRCYSSPWYVPKPGEAVPAGFDWDMWCGQAKLLPYNHEYVFLGSAQKRHAKTGRDMPDWPGQIWFGGAGMTNWGAHGFDMVQWALGMDGSGPVEVEAVKGHWGGTVDDPLPNPPRPGEVGYVKWTYANGVVLETGDGPKAGGQFFCEKGEITINRNRLNISPPSLARELLRDRDVRRNTRDTQHMLNFLDCVRTRKRPNADVEIGHTSVILGHLGNIVRMVGGKLRWSPEKQEFVGSPLANSMLDRERRRRYNLPDWQ